MREWLRLQTGITYLSLICSLLFSSASVFSNELSQVIGETVGQDQTLVLPDGAKLSYFNIYFNHDGQQSEITGIQFVYATVPEGLVVTSALAGSKGSKSARYLGGEKGGFKLDTFEFERAAVSGNPLSNLMIKNGFYGTGWGVTGAGGQKVVKKLDPSQEFGGLIVRTDGQKIYGLGVIARDQNTVASDQQSSYSQIDTPFATPANDNPFAEPENPFAVTTQTPIARRPGDTQTPGGGNMGAPAPVIPGDQLFVDYWVEAATEVTHPNPPPKKDSKEYAYWESRYISPLTIKVQKGPSGSIIIENVNGYLDSDKKENEYKRAPTVGHGTFVLRKANETTYQSGSIKAVLKRGAHSGEDLLFLQVPEPWDFLSRSYERAKLPFSLALSSNRFTAEQQGRRTARDDSFSTLVKLYQPSLYGYDPSLIDPLDPGVGMKKQLFASSDLQEYSFDDALSKGVPYGLKGYNLLKSSNTVRSISTSSEVQAQEETSRSMGVNVVGFGANFSEEFVTSSRKNTSVSTTLSLLKAYSYALVQDFPNGKLHFYFRNQIETLIEQPNSGDLAPYEKIVEDFGTHYANAITYGGMAYNESTTSTRESAQSLVEKWNASLSGEANGVSANLSSSEGQTDSSTTRLEQTKENWTSIGGSGGFDKGSFQVNDDKLMPVAYDLRSISELINVVFFPTDGDQKKIRRVLQVRQMLGHAINKKLNALPRLSHETRATSRVYRLNVLSIKCTHGNKLDRNKIQLSGKFDLNVTDSLGSRTENIFNVPIVERERVQVIKLDCGPQALEHEINRDFILVNSVERPSEPIFELIASDLYSYIKPVYSGQDKAALNPFLRDVVSPVGETILGLFVGRKETREELGVEYRDILLKASHKLHARTDQKRGVTKAELYPGPKPLEGIIIYGTPDGGNIWVKYTIEKLQ